MPTTAEAIGRLRWINGHVAMAIWQRSDVFDQAKRRGITITKDEADQILDEMDRNQDCTVGITWDTIDYYLDELTRANRQG